MGRTPVVTPRAKNPVPRAAARKETTRVTRAMQRASTHDERVFVYRVETDRGIVGWGDCQGGRYEVEPLVGRHPFAIMHDDAIFGVGYFMPANKVFHKSVKDVGLVWERTDPKAMWLDK